MTIILKNKNIAFFAVPKCACTSIKRLLFEIDNGFAWRNFEIDGRVTHIHSVYPTRTISNSLRDKADGLFKIAIVRDPAARLVSCYRNRVLHYKELSARRISAPFQAIGARPEPDLDTFIEKLWLYRRASKSIKHHSEKLSYYLGCNPLWFDRIYDISEVPVFIEELRSRFGDISPLERIQDGGPPMTVADLREDHLDKIRKIYREDYEIFGEYFSRSPDLHLSSDPD